MRLRLRQRQRHRLRTKLATTPGQHRQDRCEGKRDIAATQQRASGIGDVGWRCGAGRIWWPLRAAGSLILRQRPRFRKAAMIGSFAGRPCRPAEVLRSGPRCRFTDRAQEQEHAIKHSSDIEIARAVLKPITEIGAGIPGPSLVPYGHTKAKVDFDFINQLKDRDNGKLMLVTGITPAYQGRPARPRRTVRRAARIGKRALTALREPSLGPCFSMKGGAAGGYAEVYLWKTSICTSRAICAITAHNLLSAMIDNRINWGNETALDVRRISWRRVLDMNDRALRDITVALGSLGNNVRRMDRHYRRVRSDGNPLPRRGSRRPAPPPRQHRGG